MPLYEDRIIHEEKSEETHKQLVQVLEQLDTHMQKREAGPSPHTIHKMSSKWIQGLHKRAKIIKLIEENIGVNLCDLNLTMIS